MLGSCQQLSGQGGERDPEKLREIREAERIENSIFQCSPCREGTTMTEHGAENKLLDNVNT